MNNFCWLSWVRQWFGSQQGKQWFSYLSTSKSTTYEPTWVYWQVIYELISVKMFSWESNWHVISCFLSTEGHRAFEWSCLAGYLWCASITGTGKLFFWSCPVKHSFVCQLKSSMIACILHLLNIEVLRCRNTTSDDHLSCHGLLTSVWRTSFKHNLPTPRLIVPTSSPDVLSAVIHTLSQRELLYCTCIIY